MADDQGSTGSPRESTEELRNDIKKRLSQARRSERDLLLAPWTGQPGYYR